MKHYVIVVTLDSFRQKFSILESTLPINLMCTPQEDISVLDKVVTIYCALCNCCDSVVSME